MESFRIEILNQKAISLLKDLADLNLIRIKKENTNSEFQDLLAKLRSNEDMAPDIDEISTEVDSVRKARYEK